MWKYILIFGLLFNTSFAFAGKEKSKKQQTAPPAVFVLWNADTGEYITGKNDTEVRPIASITKLMTALVVIQANLDLDQELVVTGKEHSTRIRRGMLIKRGALIELALISSDNLAARTLAETHPGGYNSFIEDMNAAALELDMHDTKFVDATGLLPGNVSTAHDIKKLVETLTPYVIINNAANTTKAVYTTTVYRKNGVRPVVIQAVNTNSFVGKFEIIAAKTGYTSKAGRCLTMLFMHEGTKYLLVVMGAQTSQDRRKMVEQLVDMVK